MGAGGGVAVGGAGGGAGGGTAGGTGAGGGVAVGGAGGGGAAGSCPFKLCEGFEDVASGQPPNPATWTRSSNSILVDTTHANRGTRALHMLVTNAPAEPFIRETKTFPAAGNAFYGRLFFLIGASPNSFAHWTIVEARGSGNNNRIRYGGLFGNNGISNHTYLFNVETQGAANPSEKALTDDANAAIPKNSWVCMEWFFDGTNNEARIWSNGVERTMSHATSTTLNGPYVIPQMTSLNIGLAVYQGIGSPYEFWIDDIAIDSQRIGCQP
jgi:hypothetical protein